jgi:hypothetical protein
MRTLQQRPPGLVDASTVQADMDAASPTPRDWPLLVQSPGEVPGAPLFLTRCRWCGWTSPRQATPDAAMAAFAAHACPERPA